MSDDLTARVEELGGLYRELTSLVGEGRWRHAAEIAGALEVDLDELRERLRAQHRAELKAARDANRADVVARLRAGAGKRLKNWRSQRSLRSDRPRADA